MYKIQLNLSNSSSFNSSIRLIRYFSVGRGRIPRRGRIIFCVHFCLSNSSSTNSSICSIRHLFLSLRSILFGYYVICSFVFDA